MVEFICKIRKFADNYLTSSSFFQFTLKPLSLSISQWNVVKCTYQFRCRTMDVNTVNNKACFDAVAGRKRGSKQTTAGYAGGMHYFYV